VAIFVCNGDFSVTLSRCKGKKIISVNIEIQDDFPVFSGVNEFFSFFHTTGDNSRHQFHLSLKTSRQNKSLFVSDQLLFTVTYVTEKGMATLAGEK